MILESYNDYEQIHPQIMECLTNRAVTAVEHLASSRASNVFTKITRWKSGVPVLLSTLLRRSCNVRPEMTAIETLAEMFRCSSIVCCFFRLDKPIREQLPDADKRMLGKCEHALKTTQQEIRQGKINIGNLDIIEANMMQFRDLLKDGIGDQKIDDSIRACVNRKDAFQQRKLAVASLVRYVDCENI